MAEITDPDRASAYDAVLFVSFGGPDGPDDVMPFLENVLRGRNVPRERMLEVAEHYHHFGGKSPINEQNLALLAALRAELDRRGPRIPVYWGNRNWHPLLTDTLREMADGRAVAGAGALHGPQHPDVDGRHEQIRAPARGVVPPRGRAGRRD
jgi:hypothetical protein